MIFNGKTSLLLPEDANNREKADARRFARVLKREKGLELTVTGSRRSLSSPNIEMIRLKHRSLPKELKERPAVGCKPADEYFRIDAEENGIRLSAVTEKGFFYACQTLLQHIGINNQDGAFSMKAIHIEDWPSLALRGVMLDPARACWKTVYPVEFLKQYIRFMSHLKMNLLVLHLTDSQGHRLPSKAFPNISKRSGKKGQWHYSAAELREVVKFAREHHVEIIPELAFLAHSTFLRKELPDLNCGKKNVICMGSESTYRIIEKLIAENVPLFDSDYFHLGMDEANLAGPCPHCDERKRKARLSSDKELFFYFLKRIRNILKKHGKKLIVWNDTVWCDYVKRDYWNVPHLKSDLKKLPKDILLHFWLWEDPMPLLKAGFNMLFSQREYFYPTTSGYTSALDWMPGSYGRHRKQLPGAVICLWGGESDDEQKGSYDVWPEIAATAEKCWAGDESMKKADLKKVLTAFPVSLSAPKVKGPTK